MTERKRVLVLAYMVSPKRGSEFAVAWNYIQTMRSHCDLTVLYGTAGQHMGDVEDFPSPDFIDRSAYAEVDFRFVATPRLARWLNALNRRGILIYSFYLAYRVWHRAAGREARRLAAQQQFDLIHYVGPIGYREPGYLWQLPLPYIWGPIGGATSFPWKFRRALPWASRVQLIGRTVVNALQLRLSRRVGRALERTDYLFTATTENQKIFEKHWNRQSQYLPENGISGPITLNLAKFPISTIRIVWIGSIEGRKGLVLLIEALSRLRRPTHLRVDIFGDGPLRQGLEKLAIERGVADVLVWHGQVGRDTVIKAMNDAHLHVITGLNEGNPTSTWEALERSVPILTLDHCGMHDVVGPAYGIRIPVTDIESTTKAMANALQQLIDAPDRLETMARACEGACDQFRLDHRPPVLLHAYESAIVRYRERNAFP